MLFAIRPSDKCDNCGHKAALHNDDGVCCVGIDFKLAFFDGAGAMMKKCFCDWFLEREKE